MPPTSVISGPSRFRRVVTANAGGTSHVLMAGPARQLGTLHEIWASGAGGSEAADAAEGPVRIAPPPGGTVFRFVEIEPESKHAGLTAEERRQAVRHAFSRVGALDALVDTSRHPAMHRTQTIDYIVLLDGELTMLLDEGEVTLQPFDVVVQRGTNHAWINRGDKPALLAAVLISA